MRIFGKIIICWLAAGLWSLGWAAEITSEWELAKESAGISILTRALPGEKFKEFKATVKMKTEVATIVELYFDVDRCKDWIPDCKVSYLVEKSSPDNISIYSEINNPWPIKNRDYVLQNKLTRNSETGAVLIEFEDRKAAVAESKCCVRMNKIKGFWQFAPVEEGFVMVTYQYQFDPGGDLPASVINAALPDLPFETLTKMRNLVEHKN